MRRTRLFMSLLGLFPTLVLFSCETTKTLTKDYWIDCVNCPIPVMLNGIPQDTPLAGGEIGLKKSSTDWSVDTPIVETKNPFTGQQEITGWKNDYGVESSISTKVPISVQVFKYTNGRPAVYLQDISIEDSIKCSFFGIGYSNTEYSEIKAKVIMAYADMSAGDDSSIPAEHEEVGQEEAEQ